MRSSKNHLLAVLILIPITCEVHLQILRMADMLSDGIIKQFPEKLK